VSNSVPDNDNDNDSARRLAPAAARNRDVILAVLDRVLPKSGVVLEIASGTGQHAVHFAQALPGLIWQPSDADEASRASIDAWRKHIAVANPIANLKAPVALDVRVSPWPVPDVLDGIVCINMIHIAPWAAAVALFDGAAAHLSPNGVLFLYGPYKREGEHTAPSNEAFDTQLRTTDPAWGVRDLEDVVALAHRNGFALDEIVPMPANNLSLVFKRNAV
jgi:SAM-dependent methyltransferase